LLQYAGVDFSNDKVRVVLVARDSTVTLEHETRLLGLTADADGAAASIAPAEWTRAADFALREAFLALPVSSRQIAGIGLSGPSGWIAIDRELRPMAALRLCAPDRVGAEIAAWLAEDERHKRRVEMLLSPKDWYRFASSQTFAADITSAARESLLSDSGNDWDRGRLAAHSIERAWMPPVFPPSARTGRFGERGAAETGLPGSPWLAAGCSRESAALLAAGDLRRRKLWCAPDGTRAVYTTPSRPAVVPDGFLALPAPWEGHWSLERTFSPERERGAELERARADLVSSGLEVEAVIETRGDPAVGAALCAAIATGLVKDWDRLYRVYRVPGDSDEPAADASSDAGEARPEEA